MQKRDAPPARPEKLSCNVQVDSGRLLFEYRPREWGGSCFLILWLIAWTVGCVALLGAVINDPQVVLFLFAIPFWASWIFVACILLNGLFAHEQFSLDSSGANYKRRVFIPIKIRRVPLGEIERFLSYSRITDSDSGTVAWGIKMLTLGKSLRFAEGICDQERIWLEWKLNDLLENLSRPRESLLVASDAEELLDEAGSYEEKDDVNEGKVIVLGKEPRKPPSDCRWIKWDDFDSIHFHRRGRFGCGAILGLLFVNAFWNGIVSVFVMGLWGFADIENVPQGAAWWGMFVFLIPFEVIGLLMFIGLLAAITAPLQRTTWRVGRNFIERRRTLLGLGPRKTSWIDSVDRIEIRGDSRESRAFKSIARFEDSDESEGEVALALVGRDNTDVCTIGDLTEGEARWIADVILREREAWFR